MGACEQRKRALLETVLKNIRLIVWLPGWVGHVEYEGWSDSRVAGHRDSRGQVRVIQVLWPSDNAAKTTAVGGCLR
jgi:hypothetical protein